MHHLLPFLKVSGGSLESKINNLLSCFTDFVYLSFRETLHIYQLLLGCECYCFYCVITSFLEFLNISCVDAFLLECFDGSGTIKLYLFLLSLSHIFLLSLLHSPAYNYFNSSYSCNLKSDEHARVVHSNL